MDFRRLSVYNVMDIRERVEDIANSKRMTISQLHEWLLKKTRNMKCCMNGECVGAEYQIGDIVFRCRGHCYSLELHAKFLDSEYELIDTLCDH